MPYRRTERIEKRLQARRAALLAAARGIAADYGLAAVQIAPVAERAGTAAGTVYRYFPSKQHLVEALVADIEAEELEAMRAVAAAAPGPLSALTAAIACFSARAIHHRRLIWAVTGESVEPEAEPAQRHFRAAVAQEFASRVADIRSGGLAGDADPALLGAAITGLVIEALAGPLAPARGEGPGMERALAQAITLCALRAAGVVDARARGLVVQAPWPAG